MPGKYSPLENFLRALPSAEPQADISALEGEISQLGGAE